MVGLSRFVAYIPNKECWKPVRDQSYSPKGLTARCPRNTFKASNSPPDQMQPGNNEKHWPLRLEPVSVRSQSQAVAGGIFLKINAGTQQKMRQMRPFPFSEEEVLRHR